MSSPVLSMRPGETWAYYNIDDPTESTGMVIEFVTVLRKVDGRDIDKCDKCGAGHRDWSCRCWFVLITNATTGRMWVKQQMLPRDYDMRGYRRIA